MSQNEKYNLALNAYIRGMNSPTIDERELTRIVNELVEEN